MRLTLRQIAGEYAVCRLPAGTAIPEWAGDAFSSVTRTADETSIVCRAAAVPAGIKAERGWQLLRVAGTLAFDQVGVIQTLATPLAAAGLSIFVVSTFDTDYLLVRAADLQAAEAALRAAGHLITADLPT